MREKYVRVNGELAEVTEEVYSTYYKMRRREKTLVEKDIRNRLVYYDAWDDGETTGREALADTRTVTPEDILIEKATRDRLYNCLALLAEAEHDLIHALFFEGKSITEIAQSGGIPHSTVRARRDSALKKLRRLMADD